jgi:hypothetical protein
MVTRATLERVVLRTAAELRALADADDVPPRVRSVLIAHVDELRSVLPREAELEIDQRPLF